MLIYGNPAMESVRAVQSSTLVREWNRLGVFTPLKRMAYPDEATTQEELHFLVDLQGTVTPDRLAYCKRVDVDLYGVMSEFLANYGIMETAVTIQQHITLYDPVIDYLKMVFNRPRPFQTAGVYGIPLYPLVKTDASDSSYPSGHTLLSLFFRHVYMEEYPELADDLMEFVLDIKLTREQGGVHYPSDSEFSIAVYEHIAPWMTATQQVYATRS